MTFQNLLSRKKKKKKEPKKAIARHPSSKREKSRSSMEGGRNIFMGGDGVFFGEKNRFFAHNLREGGRKKTTSEPGREDSPSSLSRCIGKREGRWEVLMRSFKKKGVKSNKILQNRHRKRGKKESGFISNAD